MKICPTCHHTYPDDFSHCPLDGAHLAAQASEADAQLAAGLSRRFRILRRLGAGGMGTVFLAEQITVGNRLVALKVLSRKLLDDPEFLLRFQNEAASTGRIDNTNVVTIYESGQADDGTPYIAMKYLEGETLRHALKARGAFLVAECVEILQQTAHGLNAAHKLGIIHRDLKPDNIFLTRGDEGELTVTVVDFGIAKLRESATHTLTGTVLGTPAYMSYEQASGMKSDELDARSDIYSLGVVVYEMLTGRVPFHSDTPLGYVRKHMMEAPPPFRAVKPDLPAPPPVERVVMKALTKDRAERYGSVLEFAREFARAAAPQVTPEEVELPPTVVVVGGAAAPIGGHLEQPQDRGTLPAPVHTPPSPPPTDRIEPPKKEAPSPEGILQVSPAASAVAESPKFALASEWRRWAKYAVAGIAGLAVLLFGVWYFSPSKTKQSPLQTQPEQQSASVGPAQGQVGPNPSPPEIKQTPERTQPAQEPTNSVPAPVQVRVNPKDGLNYVWIPPGKFEMGCSPGDKECFDDEKPAHQVTLSKGFWIGQTDVTAGAYKRFAGSTGREMPTDADNMPAVNMSWGDAQAYCGWVGARLPTEAEWEYAARGGTTGPRYGPIDEIAWYRKDIGCPTHEVAQKRPNDFGLYDMLGNVWQWVNDWNGHYRSSPSQDPQGPGSGRKRVFRGGSCMEGGGDIRASIRANDTPDSRATNVSFRCAGEVFGP